MLTATVATTIFLLLFRLLRLRGARRLTATHGRPPATMPAGHTPRRPQQPPA
jgi:hypothetical protein